MASDFGRSPGAARFGKDMRWWPLLGVLEGPYAAAAAAAAAALLVGVRVRLLRPSIGC
jgi:hypothetical protein